VPRLQKQLICGLFDRVFVVSGGRRNLAVGAEARTNASSRARPEKVSFVGGAACVPARRTCPRTASPSPCTCVGEPATASTAGKLLAAFKDTSSYRLCRGPRRGCSGREAPWGNDTASRRHSIRRFQRVERKAVAAVVRRARKQALQRGRCKCLQARPRRARESCWHASNAASPPATPRGNSATLRGHARETSDRARGHRRRSADAGDARATTANTSHTQPLNAGSPASSK
jgi:hypothetical protein